MIRGIVLSALVAGLAASLVLTAVQRYQVVPIILEAETYESAAAADHAADHVDGNRQASQAGGGEAAAHVHDTAGHDAAGHEAWAPEDGIERALWTALANAGVGIGFALLLCAAYAWRGGVGMREGVLWGIAGFLVFFVNPSFGLQPEIPGAASAELGARQLWWIGTVACTALGVGLVVFGRGAGTAAAGALLCLVPHVIGAPQPGAAGGNAPLELAHAFVGASYVANGVFWIVLGAASAYAFTRLARLERPDAAA